MILRKPAIWDWSRAALEQPYREAASRLLGLYPMWGHFDAGGLRDLTGIMGDFSTKSGTTWSVTRSSEDGNQNYQKTNGADYFQNPGSWTPPQAGSVLLVMAPTAAANGRALGFDDDFEIRIDAGPTLSNQLFGAGANTTDTAFTGLTKHAFICTWDNTLATPERSNFVDGVKATGTETFSDPGSASGTMSIGTRDTQTSGQVGEYGLVAFFDGVLPDGLATLLTLVDPYGLVREGSLTSYFLMGEIISAAPAVPPAPDVIRSKFVKSAFDESHTMIHGL